MKESVVTVTRRPSPPTPPHPLSPTGSEGGVSEAADSSFRPGAAEPGAERSLPAADQARLGPASPGTGFIFQKKVESQTRK